jgi:hypothetical protein
MPFLGSLGEALGFGNSQKVLYGLKVHSSYFANPSKSLAKEAIDFRFLQVLDFLHHP